jgi:hypothetical protein
MESNSPNAPSANGSVGVEAAGKAGEWETNAPNLLEAPQAAKGRETNAPCQRKTAENTGTRETNVSEKKTAARGETEGLQPSRNRGGGRESQWPPNTQRLASCRPNSGRGDHHGHPANNRPGPW